MPYGLFGSSAPHTSRRTRPAAPMLSPEEEAMARRQGISPEEFLADRAQWSGAQVAPRPQSQGAPSGGMFGRSASQAPAQVMQQPMAEASAVPPRGMFGSSAPKPKKGGGVAGMFGYDPESSGMGALEWWFSTPDRRDKARDRAKVESLSEMFAGLDLDPEELVLAKADPVGYAEMRTKRRDELRKPVIAGAGARGFVRNDEGEFDEVFNVPDPSAAPLGSKAFAHVIQPDGSVAVIMNDASTRVTDLNAADSMRTVDVGGVPVVLSGRTGAGAPVSVGGGPGQASGRSSGAGVAPPVTAQTVGQNKATIEDITSRQKAQTEAAIDLPKTIAAAEENIKVVQDMMNHPGFGKRYGLQSLGGAIPPIPGGDAAGAQAYINQVKGAAFLEAFESLRGGGQISNIEGTKAEQAKTRLSYQGISEEEARKAAQELIDLMNARIRRAKAKAGMLSQDEWSKLSDEELEEIAQGQ